MRGFFYQSKRTIILRHHKYSSRSQAKYSIDENDEYSGFFSLLGFAESMLSTERTHGARVRGSAALMKRVLKCPRQSWWGVSPHSRSGRWLSWGGTPSRDPSWTGCRTCPWRSRCPATFVRRASPSPAGQKTCLSSHGPQQPCGYALQRTLWQDLPLHTTRKTSRPWRLRRTSSKTCASHRGQYG